MTTELERDAICHLKAKQRGEKTFTLVQQDMTGPSVICEWIKQNIETAPADKLRDALEAAIEFRDYSRRKRAD